VNNRLLLKTPGEANSPGRYRRSSVSRQTITDRSEIDCSTSGFDVSDAERRQRLSLYRTAGWRIGPYIGAEPTD